MGPRLLTAAVALCLRGGAGLHRTAAAAADGSSLLQVQVHAHSGEAVTENDTSQDPVVLPAAAPVQQVQARPGQGVVDNDSIHDPVVQTNASDGVAAGGSTLSDVDSSAPQPVSIEAMRNISPVERRMVEYKMRDGNIIYGYDKSEDTFISGALSKGRLWRARESNQFCKLFAAVPGRADFLDVGANIGTWTIPMSSCLQSYGKGGRVIAVEAARPIAEYLEASVARNSYAGNIDVYDYAVGEDDADASGAANATVHEVTLHLHPTNKGGSSIVNEDEGSTPINATMTTLDSILSGKDFQIYGLKMDIEGYEGRALKGAKRLLANPPCILQIELSKRFLVKADTAMQDVINLLDEAGYNISKQDREPATLSGLFLQRDFAQCQARFREAAWEKRTSTCTHVAQGGWNRDKGKVTVGMPAACMASCKADPSCRGLSWRSADSVCFYFTQTCGAGLTAPPDAPCEGAWCNYDLIEAQRVDGGSPKAEGAGFSIHDSVVRSAHSGDSKAVEAVRLIEIGGVCDPQPVPLEVMRNITPAGRRMVEYAMRDGVVIYGYEKSEDTFVSGSLARGNLWRGRESGELCKHFKKVHGRADFLDVGANIGTWAIPMARCLRSRGFGGQVIAVEGAQPIAEYLEASVVRNDFADVVRVYEYVVGDGNVTSEEIANETAHQVKMYVDPTNKGGSSLLTRADDSTQVNASLTTLDSILNRSDARIFGMKIDVEGYEGRALQGARQLLLANPPCVLNLELSKKLLTRAGTDLHDLMEMLRNAGYDIPASDKEPTSIRAMYLQRDFEQCQARFYENTSEAVEDAEPDRGDVAAAAAPPVRLTDIGFVREPQPVSLEAMRGIAPAEKSMVEYPMRDGTILYGYNRSEDEFVSGALAKGRLWESRSSSEFCKLFQGVKGRADFLDVGANIGTWTIPMARCLQSQGMGGRVVAVEGVRPIAEYLEASVVRNSVEGNLNATGVDVYNYVVGDGFVTPELVGNATASSLRISLDPTNKGGSSIINQAENATFVDAQMTALDSILNVSNIKVFGMKMDIEGNEGRALKEAKRLLANPPCILNIELNRKFLSRAGTPREDVVEMLRHAGYNISTDGRPSITSDLYFQTDFESCKARFQ